MNETQDKMNAAAYQQLRGMANNYPGYVIDPRGQMNAATQTAPDDSVASILALIDDRLGSLSEAARRSEALANAVAGYPPPRPAMDAKGAEVPQDLVRQLKTRAEALAYGTQYIHEQLARIERALGHGNG